MSVDAPTTTSEPEDVAERILGSALGTIELMSIYLGDKLGWYRSLADEGPATAVELAARTSTDERYAREWLEQQAVVGFLHADVTETPPRFHLPASVGEVLLDPHSLNLIGPIARMLFAAAQRLPELLTAYRDGGGVSWERLGPDARESQAELNRPWFENRLGAELAGVPDVHAVLSRPGARILDVGCGGGWSTIALAEAYPQATLVGLDVDAASVELAGQNAESAGVADRATFSWADASTLGADEPYDAAFAFECVHDMPRPLDVLHAIREAVDPDGLVIVMDEAVSDRFDGPGDDLDRLMYGFSLAVCLPDGRSSSPSAATGTVMRADTLRRYAREAGFSRTEILPIEDFSFFRFYRLRH